MTFQLSISPNSAGAFNAPRLNVGFNACPAQTFERGDQLLITPPVDVPVAANLLREARIVEGRSPVLRQRRRSGAEHDPGKRDNSQSFMLSCQHEKMIGAIGRGGYPRKRADPAGWIQAIHPAPPAWRTTCSRQPASDPTPSRPCDSNETRVAGAMPPRVSFEPDHHLEFAQPGRPRPDRDRHRSLLTCTGLL